MVSTLLASHLPESSIDIVSHWIGQQPVQIRISKERTSKSGDYRPPDKSTNYHRISINYNLNKFAFLITFAHEYAHLLTWIQYKRKAKPHGDEWENAYKKLIFSLIEEKIFPNDIEFALIQTLVINSLPIHTAEYNLTVILSKYDNEINRQFLKELVQDSIFSIPNGAIFRKGDKVRTRYKCYCLNNKRWYLISPAMQVKPISNALEFPANTL